MHKARKPWLFRKPGRRGHWVGWTDQAGKRHNKSFPNKTLAEQFKARLTVELNDAYHPPTDPKAVSWDAVVEAHIQYLVFCRRKPTTLTKRRLVLKTFADLMKITSPKQVTQDVIEKYVAKNAQRTTRFHRQPAEASIAGDIAHLRSFIRWAVKPTNRFLAGPFDLPKAINKQWREPYALTEEQVAKTLALFNDNKVVEHPDAWRVRMILAFHGIRRSDIEKLRPSDFDPVKKQVRAFKEKKTDKWNSRDIEENLWPWVWSYVQIQSPTAERLFPDTVTSKKWRRICEAAGLPYGEFRFHDTRVTFATAMAEQGVPTGVTQKLLNHCTPNLTNQVYTKFDRTLRPATNKLPGKLWGKDIHPQAEGQADETQAA